MSRAREQIPAPVVRPPTGDLLPPNPPPLMGVASQAGQLPPAPKASIATLGTQIVNPEPPAPPRVDLPTRALTAGGALAREYALAAAAQCDYADAVPGSRANARRLLRLALAHLEN